MSDATHGLLVMRTGPDGETLPFDGFAPEFHDLVVDWVAERAVRSRAWPRLRPWLVALIVAGLAGCVGAGGDPDRRGEAAAGAGAAETTTAAVSAAMDSVYDRFTRAYRLGEPDSVVVLYADSPLYLPGQGDILRGRAALRGAFGFLDRIREDGGTAHIEFESVARDASGDLAFDIGYYTIQVEQPDGTLMPPNRGKFTTVWERGSDGKWRIRVDGFSPAPPPESSPE